MDKTNKMILVIGLSILSLGLFMPVLADSGSGFIGMMGNFGMMGGHMGDNHMSEDHMDMMHMMNAEDCDEENMRDYHDECEYHDDEHTFEECNEIDHEECYLD